jgi:Cu/Ag efflux protein CusF
MSRPLRTNQVAVSIVVVLLSIAAGCSRQEDKNESSAQHHRIRGLVMALDSARNRVIIAHEEIPHYMKAMTMPFTVRERGLLQGIEVGDSVLGFVTVKKSEVWLDSLTVVAKVPFSEAPQ